MSTKILQGHAIHHCAIRNFKQLFLVQGMKNQTSGKIVSAYMILIARLKSAGIEPILHSLDIECLQEYKDDITGIGIKDQLVPPNDHRRNISEKAIQTCKDHFVAVLCWTDEKFPM